MNFVQSHPPMFSPRNLGMPYPPMLGLHSMKVFSAKWSLLPDPHRFSPLKISHYMVLVRCNVLTQCHEFSASFLWCWCVPWRRSEFRGSSCGEGDKGGVLQERQLGQDIPHRRLLGSLWVSENRGILMHPFPQGQAPISVPPSCSLTIQYKFSSILYTLSVFYKKLHI